MRQLNHKQHKLSGTFIQPALEIGKEDDEHEKEANQVADKVMRMTDKDEDEKIQKMSDGSEGKLQKMQDGEEEEKMTDGGEGKLQMMMDSPLSIRKMTDGSEGGMKASENVEKGIQNTKGGGQSLAPELQSEMGNKMGADFSGVKIHTNEKAVQMNKEVGAKAFTHGNDIYFNNDQYNPSSQKGKHLLAHELTHTVQQKGASVIQREPLTEVELTAATIFNAARFTYAAPNITDPTNPSNYQLLLQQLNQVAQNETMYNAALTATTVGNDFSHLVNAAQEVLYTDDPTKHNGKLDATTLRDLRVRIGVASTPVGLNENTSFLPEVQVTAPYQHFQNDRIAGTQNNDFYVSSGFMEPAGHSAKPPARAIFTKADSFDIAAAVTFNQANVVPANVPQIIEDLHSIVHDNVLYNDARRENDGRKAFARLVYAAQIQLFSNAANINGQYSEGTRTALENRNNSLQTAAVTNAAVDPFVRELAPTVEMFENRQPMMYLSAGIPTIGVGFNLQRPDAAQLITDVGGDYNAIMNNTAGLTNAQIDSLFYADLQNIGVQGARNVVNNFNALPRIAQIALADIAFDIGQTGLAAFPNMIDAFQRLDYTRAAQEMRNSAWFNQSGQRGLHHVQAINYLASIQQPGITNLPAAHRNLGIDYVVQSTGQDVYAWYGGLVTQSGLEGGYGNRIRIETDVTYIYEGNEYVVYQGYGHLDSRDVSQGQIVSHGDIIGEMGGTGTNGAVNAYPQHVDLRTWIMVGNDMVDLSPNVLEKQLAQRQQGN